MGKRGRRTDVSDSDEDYEEESPSQRQRVDEEDDGDVDYVDEPESQFVKGAIVKVVLRNFMTYGGPVEIKPGPRLNLVLGPNGTGKSSFVCAMCLGLGFPTKLLGRAKDIKEFVKSGEQAAEITISLSQGAGERPLQIYRRITKDGTSQFRMHGKPSNAKEVAKKMQEMAVQMDNLCQFLPQDRVVAFAQLSPIQLLEETEKAVDEEGLFQEHEWLKSTKASIKGNEAKLARDKEELARLEEVQASSERDVRRVQERNKLEEEKQLLERSLPWLEAEEGRKRYDEAKKAEAGWAAEVSKRKKEAEEASAPMKHLDNEFARLKAEEEKSKAANRKENETIAKLHGDCDKLEKDIENIKNEIAREDKKEQKRLNDIKKMEAELAAKQKDLSELQPPAEMLSPNELAELDQNVKKHDMAIREIARHQKEVADVIQHHRTLVSQAERQIQAISSVREKRLATLLQALRGPRGMNPQADEIQRTVDFVEKAAAEGKFQHPVYGPIACEIQTRDAQTAAYIEQAVGNKFLRQFVVLSQADYNLLRQNTKANVTYYAGNPDEPIPDEIPAELMTELAQFGISDRLDRTFDAPAVVKKVLCDMSMVHRQVVGTERAAAKVKEVIAAAESRGIRNLGSIWTPTSCFSSNRSRYGDKALSTAVNPIKPPKFIGRIADDSGRKAEAEQRRAEALSTIMESEQELQMYSKQRKEAEEQLAEANRKRERVSNAQMTYERARRALQETIKDVSRRLEGERRHPGSAENKAKLQKRLEAASARLCAAALQAALVLAESVRNTVEVHTPVTLAIKEVKARKDALVKDLQKTLQSVDEAKKEQAKAREKLEAAKAHAKDLVAKAKKVGEVSAEENNRVTEIVRKSKAAAAGGGGAAADDDEDEDADAVDADALRAAIEDKRAQISAIFCADPSVVQQYQERAKKIDELSKSVKEMERDVDGVLSSIEARKAAWLPKLRGVIQTIAEKFANSFAIIGSVGTVDLFEPEDGDFAKYEARIRVRFRDGEQMSQLTANRQSGGERSVSTMFYLICLQDMTRCPFRMVDEINQGMDKKNERLVFQEMVRTSSKANTPQCFLITPKLLPQLDYGKFTTVHVIYNGPHVADVARGFAPERIFGSVPQTPMQTAEVF